MIEWEDPIQRFEGSQTFGSLLTNMYKEEYLIIIAIRKFASRETDLVEGERGQEVILSNKSVDTQRLSYFTFIFNSIRLKKIEK